MESVISEEEIEELDPQPPQRVRPPPKKPPDLWSGASNFMEPGEESKVRLMDLEFGTDGVHGQTRKIDDTYVKELVVDMTQKPPTVPL